MGDVATVLVRSSLAFRVNAPTTSALRAIGVLVLLCACACGCSGRQAQSAEPTLAAGGELPPRDAGQRCSRERMPGSHIKREVCRGSAQGGSERDATERMLRQPTPVDPMAE